MLVRALVEFIGPLIPLVVLANKMKIGKLATDLFGLAKSLDVKIAGRGAAPALQNVQGQLQGMGTEMDATKQKGGAFQTAMGVMAAGVGGFMAGMAKDAKGAVAGIAVSLTGIGIAFAQGGWIGAGVAAVAAGVGFVVGRWKRGQEEAKAEARATEKLYKEIGESQKRALQGAFEDVGTTALTRRDDVGLKAFQTMLKDGTKGADTFAKAFGVSMEETASAMEQPIGKFEEWTVEVRHNRIADVLRGDKDAWAVWGDDAEAAGHKVANFMSSTSDTIKLSSGKTHSALVELGAQLESGAISWSEYAAKAKAAGVEQEVLARGSVMMTKEINAAMLASESGAFLDTLPTKLKAAGDAYMTERQVEQAYIDHQEAMKPASQKTVESLQKIKAKVDEIAEAYYNAMFAHEDFLATQAGGALGISEELKKLYGAPKEGQEGIDQTQLKGQLEAQVAVAGAGKKFSEMLAGQVVAIGDAGGSYQDLLDWQGQVREDQKLLLQQAGVPLTPKIIEQINSVTSITPEAIIKLDVRSLINGVPRNLQQLAEEQVKFEEILKMSDGKEYTTALANFTKANGVLTPLQNQQLFVREFNQSLAGMNGKVAQTQANHFVTENTKGMSQQEISAWATKHGISLKNIDKAEAATKTTQTTTENGVKKGSPKLSAETRDLQEKIHGLNHSTATTKTTHGSSENSGKKPMTGIAGGAGALYGALGTLNNTNAGSSSNTETTENGRRNAAWAITDGLGGIWDGVDRLDGKNAHSTVTLDLIDNASGQIRLIADMFGFAEGGYVNKPTAALIGEAGPEIVLPITDTARSMQLLTRYAPELVGATAGTGLDRIVLGPGGTSKSSTNKATGSVTGLNIENATFQDGTDADLVAARIRSSLRLLGVT